MSENLRRSDVSRQAGELQRTHAGIRRLNGMLEELRNELADVRGDLAEAVDIFQEMTAYSGQSGLSYENDKVIKRLLKKHWPTTKDGQGEGE